MAVIRAKTPGGFAAIILLLTILAAAPHINETGVGAFLAIVILVPTVLTIFAVLMNKAATIGMVHEGYEKAIENSNGIEKMRLKIRDYSTSFGLSLKKGKNDESISISTPIMTAFILLADIFYPLMEETVRSTSKNQLFMDFSNAVTQKTEYEKDVSSRLFGIALGIAVEKAANLTNKKNKQDESKKIYQSVQFY